MARKRKTPPPNKKAHKETSYPQDHDEDDKTSKVGEAAMTAYAFPEPVSVDEVNTFRELRSGLGLSQAEFARVAGLSIRKVSALENGEVTPSASDNRRARELGRLLEELSELIRAESIGVWLRSPNPSFDDSSPLDLLARGDGDRVWRLIWRLQDNAGL